MSIRTFISPLAVAAMLSMSGGAMAQAMIGDFQIPDASMPSFEQKCQALVAADNRSLATDPDADELQTGTVGSSESVGQSTSPDPASEDREAELLASMTLEQCEAAGLIAE